MAWLDTLLSIGTTIGKVAGALSGASSMKCVHFGVAGSVNPALGQLIFVNDARGNTRAFNQSHKQGVGLSFPGNPLKNAQSTDIIIPAMGHIPIGPAFNMGSAIGSDAMMITPLLGVIKSSGPPDPQVPPDPKVPPVPPNSTIHSSTTQLLRDQATVSVGPYFKATLNVSPRTLQIALIGGLGGGLALAGLAMLNVRGATGNTVRLINALRNSSAEDDDPLQITVQLPWGIDITDGVTYLDLTAEVAGFPNSGYLPADYPYQLAPIGEDDKAMLAALTGI